MAVVAAGRHLSKYLVEWVLARVPANLQAAIPVSFVPLNHALKYVTIRAAGRYLASGADESSVYLRVERIDGDDVICKAQTSSDLSGLLTVIHARGNGAMGLNMTKLPLLSPRDIEGLRCGATLCLLHDCADRLSVYTRVSVRENEQRL